MKAGGSRYPASVETVQNNWHTIMWDGHAVFKAAVSKMSDVSVEMMERHNLKGEDIRFLVPHQANLRIIDATARRMGLEHEKCMINIDRNGIVNVSAKDLGTGNEQKVTITSSTNLTEDEINQRVKEAEQYAAEDKKRKEEVETLNHADSMIFEVDKQLKELGDKLSAEDKATVENELAEFKKVRETNDAEQIKNAMEAFTQKVYAVFGKIYQQQGAGDPNAQANGAQNADNASSDGASDADYDVH